MAIKNFFYYWKNSDANNIRRPDQGLNGFIYRLSIYHYEVLSLQIGLFCHPQKEKAFEVAKRISLWFEEKQLPLFAAGDTARRTGGNVIPLDYKQMFKELDAVIVLGGDGTFLSAARAFFGRNIPLLGFNLGHLGFLMENDVEMVDEILTKLLAGDYKIEERMMLEGRVFRNKKQIHSFVGLNDIVVNKGSFSRLIKINVYIEDDLFITYPGDGLIVATPTGSTAYSLSAGGPIINPGIESLIITPICPHMIYSRSIIIGADEEISLEMAQPQQKAAITIDGQEGVALGKKDIIKIRRGAEKTKLIRFADWSYYRLLANRLQQMKRR